MSCTACGYSKFYACEHDDVGFTTRIARREMDRARSGPGINGHACQSTVCACFAKPAAAPKGDLKEALSNKRKADITYVRLPFMCFTARGNNYGDSTKYVRGNWRVPTGGAAHAVPTRADFERLRGGLRAAMAHLAETLDAMERHQALDPELVDVAGMRRAAYAVDTDLPPGATWPASHLPHLAPAAASLNIAITQAADCGLLPRDPGPTWEDRAPTPGWE